ncbi:MAG: hypothetical protein LBC79_06600 [Deltaproteobacteria bacterium]|jgi:hypothetical protein|nr:hypothetical protein [Deltaproteobacteria bacterium]
MPKLCFLHFVGRSVPKSRVREMCRLAELDEVETRLMLERFCSGRTVGQCDFLPEDQQRTLLPSLNRRVRSWIQHNTGFFCLEELAGMAEYTPGKTPE